MSKHIQVRPLDDDVYLLTFDRQGSSANVFDGEMLDELDDRIRSLSGDMQMRGLIFYSAKESIFIAGADIKELSRCETDEALSAIIEKGQRVFGRIAALKATTVAAIHGACLGGGYELCLACDGRIASDDDRTKIGLPETSLGILPAWGGSVRLPRLIGLPKALDVILAGKRLAAGHARKYGMVDEVVPRELLVQKAREYIARGEPRRKSLFWVNNPVAARIIARKARAAVMTKTRGNYPAVTRALDVVVRGLSLPVDQALQLERNAILELACTPACRNLVRIFFMQERAKRLRVDQLPWSLPQGTTKVEPVQCAAVIGAGVMGAGIAQWISARGIPVVLRDIDVEQVGKGMARIAKTYQDGVKRRVFSAVTARQGMDRIYPVSTYVPMMARVDLVIEAAVEKMAIKKEIFKELQDATNANTLLASNTSALSLTELGRATGAGDRVIGIHFFNPVHKMPLVEIVLGEETSRGAAEQALAFVQRIGKLPVVVRDKPGFVVNRVLMPYLVEAGHLLDTGTAASVIDEAMLDFGMPMGPLRLLDEVGLDVALHVARHLNETFGDRMPAPALLERMTKEGWAGRKAGKGFYVYEGRGEPKPNEAVQGLLSSRVNEGMNGDEARRRMMCLMLNEAAACLEDKLVAGPADVDFAMIMGTGFAPFRGGPLRYADSLGIPQLCEDLEHLSGRGEERFAPCALLSDMLNEGRTFYEEH